MVNVSTNVTDDVSRKVALVKGQGNSDDYKIYDYPIGDLKR